MGCTLVIDTSYGSTVGIVGREPIVETDSRTHVERLQVNIARAIDDAGLAPSDIETIVVGIGPAPFTGLRAGIVTAKALAFATGAKLVGQNVLEPQHEMLAAVMGGHDMFAGVDFLVGLPRLVPAGVSGNPDDTAARTGDAELDRHVTLCVNDARRKQLYFTLIHGTISMPDDEADGSRWIGMDIDYPERIVERVHDVIDERSERDGVRYIVDVAGHGAAKYASAWTGLGDALGSVVDGSILDAGTDGVALFSAIALSRELRGDKKVPVEPLYLRRPDAEIPAPLKHVLNHAGAERTA
ncbi:tRNA (adenosine(37)-N6)-threonylcarbamoyltransferase complex dimerization subunit type 1 TsaB [Bifidobacterium sp. SO1]|uniref:tRNA (adenosine(37)-N6)-threonylcarbamoyltransferase complex dimerization subunit type 1 TsaB n=1 Tax=Bifidobacterium sp. SO1 TaxID=2809029 RepID=UPI001BDCF937|nr:tRNA (adenosine(37)-N6)-threonylcarbamoyltransferase complex dimerization subunit type 1 TsaB [Bifidobacterium sp. SO1]MBT1160900.1 tRNA (adenosine(37)-N6)-threonylcarbamoyltransferase complex dimerization subunit type 1 TsaB [Bifidobacterium sp. SO1]